MSRTSILISVLVTSLAACGDNQRPAAPDGGSGSPPIDGSTTPDGGGAGITEPGNGFAVVSSDFQSSTTISLLDIATGAVTKADCLDSGTVPPGTTTALSGDVALPSWPQPGHPIVAIDRRNAVLTWLDAATCAPLHQLDVSTGFMSNPQDVIGVSATKAYVTRYARNPTPTASATDFDDGDDLLIIDPSVPRITGRIDLSAYAVPLAGKQIRARPTRGRLVDGKLYIAINDIDDGFDAMSHGRVVIVDTATDKVTGTIDLPELANCGALTYVEAQKTLVVTCAGDYDQADSSLTSGLAFIDLTQSPPVETRHALAAVFGGRALGAYSGIANDGTLGFAVTPGAFGGDPADRLWSFNVAAGTAAKVSDATDAFVLGSVLIDPGHQQVLVTDAAAAKPRIHIYDYASGTATLKTDVEPEPTHHLPPRELAWY